MRQQMRHVLHVRLFIPGHDAQILLFALFAELQTIFQCDDAATDEILKYLMPAVVTGRLTEELKKSGHSRCCGHCLTDLRYRSVG